MGYKRQPYQHHTRVPAIGIYCYSFALNPEQHQPSGTVNMSRIDNATLLLNLSTSTDPVKLRVYAVNYNVLRIMAGELTSTRRQEYIQKKNMLVECFWLFQKHFATLSNCGKLLSAFTTTFIWKHLKGTQLITVPNGNNV